MHPPPPPPPSSVEAASPDRYRQFMAILCGYIVEKQQEVQGEDLPFDLVFVSHVKLIYCTVYTCRNYAMHTYIAIHSYNYMYI